MDRTTKFCIIAMAASVLFFALLEIYTGISSFRIGLFVAALILGGMLLSRTFGPGEEARIYADLNDMRRIDECRERLKYPGLSEEKKLSLQVEIDERKRNIEARMTPQDRQRRAWFLKQARKMKPGELTKEKVDELITKSRKRFKEPKEAR